MFGFVCRVYPHRGRRFRLAASRVLIPLYGPMPRRQALFDRRKGRGDSGRVGMQVVCLWTRSEKGEAQPMQRLGSGLLEYYHEQGRDLPASFAHLRIRTGSIPEFENRSDR